jgi:hypothetical protein
MRKGEKLGMLDWSEPRQEDIAQAERYAADLVHDYPELTVSRHVVYIVGAVGCRFFNL